MEVVTNRVILLGRMLKRLDNFSVASFADRLVFQKTVYLLQATGVFLGYSFNWYLHGPYSPVLARDGFELDAVYPGLKPYTFRDPKHERDFEQFSDFIQPYESNPNWLEAAASIHFLRQTFPHESKSKTIARVMKKGAHLKRDLCEKAWTALQSAQLIS